jgi:hypothetical protein
VYGLDDRGSGVRLPAEARNVSLHLHVQTGSGAHPASCPVGTGGCFSGGKAAGAEDDHSPPSSADVKKVWRHTSTPFCFHGMMLS